MTRAFGLLHRLKWRRGKFALQLTAILLLISIVPLLIYYLAFYRATEQAILDMASRHSMETLHNQKSYLLLQLDQIESLAANLSQVEEISSALVKLNSAVNADASESAYDRLATKARIGYLLSNYMNLKGLVSIDIFSLNGYHYHVGDTLTSSDERSSLRDSLLDRTLRSKASVIWHGVEDNVQKFSNSQKVLAASKLLINSNSSWLKAEPVGMLLINYSTEYLHQHFSSIDMGPGASMLVLDEQGRLIYHPDRKKIGLPVAKDFASLLRGPSGSFTQRLGQSDVLLSYEKIPDKNWYVISIIPKETLLASMLSVRQIAGIMLVVMVLFVVLLLRLFTVRIVGPIDDVAEGFKNFQLNKLVPGWRMPRPKSLESVNDLAQWFNTFLATMENRHESDTRLRIAATAFESQEGMFVADANAVILQINSALSSITGYSAAEVIGKTLDIFSSDRNGADFFDGMWRVIENTGAWHGEVWNRRKNGALYPGWLAVTGVKNDHDVITHYVASLTDITERKANEEEIRQLAFYDPLTGLPNRRLLIDRLHQAMLECRRRKQSVALMFLDLDKFKTLNDTLGHDVGDSLLKQVAQRLVRCVREVDTVARLGGDEFVLLVEGLSATAHEAAAQAEMVALKILRTLGDRYENIGNSDYQCSSSIGVTLFSDSDCKLDELMKQADIALYQAKDAGRNTLRFFDPDMQAKVMVRAALEQSMLQGLMQNEFKIHFQPKVALDKRPVGAEVLIRWQHPERGLVAPSLFVALAEETGLIVPLGQFVLRAACAQLVEWAGHPQRRNLSLAVNVSPREFRQPDFVSHVLSIIEETGADPQKLTLEITESLFVDNVHDIVDKMTALTRRGVSFAIDDFGTGYSSLAYLKRMPLRELKIDRSFVRDVLTNGNDATIARAIIALGQELGFEVVAEGVETEAQYEFLVANGCRSFQGYLFSPPRPLDDFHQLLEQACTDEVAPEF
ncbi:MAG: EAL domain-containing protein [Leptothrix sp. (in: b-proteobacteria)]